MLSARNRIIAGLSGESTRYSRFFSEFLQRGGRSQRDFKSHLNFRAARPGINRAAHQGSSWFKNIARPSPLLISLPLDALDGAARHTTERTHSPRALQQEPPSI